MAPVEYTMRRRRIDPLCNTNNKIHKVFKNETTIAIIIRSTLSADKTMAKPACLLRSTFLGLLVGLKRQLDYAYVDRIGRTTQNGFQIVGQKNYIRGGQFVFRVCERGERPNYLSS